MSKSNWQTDHFCLYGELRGEIWWPVGEEFKKDLEVKFSKDDKPWHFKADCLRDVLLRATNDGDFQSCVIDFPCMKVVRRNQVTGATKSRYFNLQGKDGNSDCYGEVLV